MSRTDLDPPPLKVGATEKENDAAVAPAQETIAEEPEAEAAAETAAAAAE